MVGICWDFLLPSFSSTFGDDYCMGFISTFFMTERWPGFSAYVLGSKWDEPPRMETSVLGLNTSWAAAKTGRGLLLHITIYKLSGRMIVLHGLGILFLTKQCFTMHMIRTSLASSESKQCIVRGNIPKFPLDPQEWGMPVLPTAHRLALFSFPWFMIKNMLSQMAPNLESFVVQEYCGTVFVTLWLWILGLNQDSKN